MKPKRCTKCGIEKSRANCHECKAAKDGLQNQCKVCRAGYYVSHRTKILEWRQKYDQSHKTERAKYNQSSVRKATCNKSQKKMRENHPENSAAHSAVQYAVKVGELIRPWYCELCFITCQPEAHHEDYSKPLEVDWLCKKCHIKLLK